MTAPRTVALRSSLLVTTFLALPPGVAPAAEPDEAGPRACLVHSSIKRTRVIDARNIVFVTRDGSHYVSQLSRPCPSMRRNSLLNYPIQSGQLCAGATFAVLMDVGMNRVPTFMCQLGPFLPRTEDEIADLEAMTGESRVKRRRTGRDMIEATPVEPPTPSADRSSSP